MQVPQPLPGLVIRYSFLWRREALEGQEEGRKDRPCAIVLAALEDQGGVRVFVLPVTHTPPAEPSLALEIPPPIKQHLRLDSERSWIVLDEFNEFLWPGFDIRAVPGSKPPRVAYGALPPRFYNQVRDAFLKLAQQRRVKRVPRD